MRAAILLGIFGTLGWGQIGAPVLGYAAEGSRVRTVLGMAQSATVARPQESGLERFLVVPGQDTLLGVMRGTGEVGIRRAGVWQSIAGAGSGPDALALSPQGEAAAAWFAGSGRLQVFAKLSETRSIVTGFLPGAPREIAVSDDGQWVAGAWPGAVYVFGPAGEFRGIPLGGARTLQFGHGSADLWIGVGQALFADRQGNLEFVSGFDGDVAAVALSAGNQRVVVAEAEGRLTALNPSGGGKRSADCGCQPSGLYRMNRTLFRVGGLEQGSYKLFDAASGEMWFAPLGVDEAQEVEQ